MGCGGPWVRVGSWESMMGFGELTGIAQSFSKS